VKIFEGSFKEDKMSKALMKLRLQKYINRQIQRENVELRMQLQALKEEKQRLDDRLLRHEEFHRSIFHYLEKKLQLWAQFHQVENEKSSVQVKDKLLAQYHATEQQSLLCT
jgi:hypothetical protein